IMRICFPLVRYTLKIPVPPADIPRLKNRAWTENLGESGNTRTAKGSSNDSSISRRVKELSRLKGGLFQSNSIGAQLYVKRPCNVFTLYLRMAVLFRQPIFSFFCQKGSNGQPDPLHTHSSRPAGEPLPHQYQYYAKKLLEILMKSGRCTQFW